jgi:hypothetical protein
MNKFDLLEKKLNIANTLLDELEIDDYCIEPTIPQVYVPSDNLPSTIVEESTSEVFSMETLKNDFTIIKQTLHKLILSGQRVLDSTSVLDPSDMKGSQISAIAMLIQTIGANSKLMIDIYKEIAMIEKTRLSANPKDQGQPGMVNQGTVVNNQILFSGDTSQLLDFIKENQKA